MHNSTAAASCTLHSTYASQSLACLRSAALYCVVRRLVHYPHLSHCV
jgi:hypothetical protein